MKHIRDHFKKNDIILFAALEQTGGLEQIFSRNTNYFIALCDEIVSQQLSGKVATVIFERFKKLFPKEEYTHEVRMTIVPGLNCNASSSPFNFDAP